MGSSGARTLTTLDVVPGTVALLCAMIGTTSFDGFSTGPTWTSLAPRLTDALRNLGLSQPTALESALTIGLLGCVLVVTGLYWLGIAGMRRENRAGASSEVLAARFVHSLVPIAIAYLVAHDRALVTFKESRIATRSQYWMLAVMIAFTSLGLWLLSSADS